MITNEHKDNSDIRPWRHISEIMLLIAEELYDDVDRKSLNDANPPHSMAQQPTAGIPGSICRTRPAFPRRGTDATD